jgi:acyl carrier protein
MTSDTNSQTPGDLRTTLLDAVIASIVAVAPEVEPDTIPEDASLRDELDLDSMDFLNVVQGIHDRTGIDVPERDYPHLATLATAVDYLLARSG